MLDGCPFMAHVANLDRKHFVCGGLSMISNFPTPRSSQGRGSGQQVVDYARSILQNLKEYIHLFWLQKGEHKRVVNSNNKAKLTTVN